MAIAKPKVFWPLVLTAANNGIVFNDGADRTAAVAVGTYLSATLLAAAIKTALDATPSALVFTVTVSSTGIITIAAGSPFVIKWSNVSSTMYAILGWTAVDTGSASSQTAPNQHQNGWYADVAPTSDTLPIRDRSSDTVTVAQGGQTKFISEVELAKREIKFSYLKPTKTFIQYESTSINQAIERWWQDGRAQFRYWPDGTVEGTFNDYVLDSDTIKEFLPSRMFTKKALYELKFLMRGYVA